MTDTPTDDAVDGGDDTPAKVGEVLERAFGPGGIGDSDPDKPAGKKPKKAPVTAGEALGYYAGLPELALGMKLTKVGDGLSTAMTVAGARHERGDKVIIITQAELRKFEHEQLSKDVDAWRVVEVFDGIRSAILPLEDPKAAQMVKLLDKQDSANAKAEEEAAGVQALDLGDDV